MKRFEETGFSIFKNQVPADLIKSVQNELTYTANRIENKNFCDANEFWNWSKTNDREKGGVLYNGFKHLHSVHSLASSSHITDALAAIGIKSPALIDINCRIDSIGEEKYLFGWHQDYWFSIASKNAVVVWIPIYEITHDLGGLDLISNEHTSGRIYKTTAGNKYNSYADAVLLNEEIPLDHAITVDNMSPTDILIFKFNLLHKSNQVTSKTRSRFTIQLRFADFDDSEFLGNDYKPGVVINKNVDYLKKG